MLILMAPKLGHNYHDCSSQDWSHVYMCLLYIDTDYQFDK